MLTNTDTHKRSTEYEGTSHLQATVSKYQACRLESQAATFTQGEVP